MNIAIVGLEKEALQSHIQKKHPFFSIVEEAPEMVLCYGGDGTLLFGEREYPGVPKVFIRKTLLSETAAEQARDTILTLIEEGKYTIRTHPKLHAQVGSQSMDALYDVVIAHPRVNGTIRVALCINEQFCDRQILGDGVVISTPIGSTGYYQSITHSTFMVGVGLAFNNSVDEMTHMVLPEDQPITLTVTRGPGVLTTDNTEEEIELEKGDEITVKRSDQSASIVEFSGPHAQYNFATNRLPYGRRELYQ